jgi:lysozyme
MAAVLPNPNLPWPIIHEGVALIADFERHPDMGKGIPLKAYRCPAGKWTNGWGETDGVGPDSVWTQEYSDQRFCDSLADYTEKVRELLTRDASDSQLAAMVSLAYNTGFGDPKHKPKPIPGFSTSTVLKAHNRGDFEAAARAFDLWNKITVDGVKRVSNGLTRRRKSEGALYLKDDAYARMPQAVEAEVPLTQSPIQQSGAVTVATGVGTILASVADPFAGYVSKMAGMAKDVGVDPLLMVGTVLAVAGGTAMYWRWKQRKGGWA